MLTMMTRMRNRTKKIRIVVQTHSRKPQVMNMDMQTAIETKRTKSKRNRNILRSQKKIVIMMSSMKTINLRYSQKL